MELEGEILQLRANLEVNMDNVSSLIELNETVIGIAQSKLDGIKKKLLQLKTGGGVIKDIENSSAFLESIESNFQIQSQKNAIKEQVVVLFVGSLESYLGDVIKTIGNVKPELFKLKNDNEQISFTQDMLKSGFKLGDAILEHITINKQYSFQDLQSSLNVFKDYLSIDIVLDDTSKDTLILCAAARNIVVHNLSTINRRFLNQIRNTAFNGSFVIDKRIDITDEIIKNSKEAIFEYADQVTSAFVEL